MSIKKAYNSWSKIYDTNVNKTRDLDKEVTIKTLSEYTFDRVLELGSGTGKNTEYLLQQSIDITCLDFSEEMMAIAREKVKNPIVKFVKTDLNKEWEVSNDFFDLVTCSLTLEHIQDLDTIFKQAYKKLKHQGKFFICELHPIKQYLGSKARYETDDGIQELEVYTHHTTDYIDSAKKQGFKLLELKEWFDADLENKIPRLISFVFQKG
ncbi:MAG TPA: class I SAM-dependent methyltransferase [Lutibacter sp.]|nr:class I SAM-dependent methyltransferase [Lutibacter sp.]